MVSNPSFTGPTIAADQACWAGLLQGTSYLPLLLSNACSGDRAVARAGQEAINSTMCFSSRCCHFLVFAEASWISPRPPITAVTGRLLNRHDDCCQRWGG